MRLAIALLFAGTCIAGAQPTNLAPFQTTINVGTTAMMNAVKANPSRKALMVCNNGPAGSIVNITFGPGTTSMPNTPSATTGVPIPGGAVVNSCLSLFPYLGQNIAMGAQLNMIASAAGTPVTVLEF